MQADETKELVSRRGWTLATELEFADEGLSGAHARRPGLQAMLEAARKRRFDVLVVYRSDRLFRSLVDLVQTLDELRELGVQFVSLHESWDTTTPNGRLMMQVCGAFAEFERAVLRERTRSGLEATRRRGTRLGRPKRQLDALRVLELVDKGWTAKRIARDQGMSRATFYRAAALDERLKNVFAAGA